RPAVDDDVVDDRLVLSAVDIDCDRIRAEVPGPQSDGACADRAWIVTDIVERPALRRPTNDLAPHSAQRERPDEVAEVRHDLHERTERWDDEPERHRRANAGLGTRDLSDRRSNGRRTGRRDHL